MRNLKKLLAVIITVAMLATLMVPAFADEDTMTAAEICEAIGMLKGTTGEVTDEYLATELTRHQMAIMFLRLRGLEKEANAFEGTDNFADADEIKYAEGKAVMAYLKANPDLGFVGSEGNFMPLKKVEAQEYFKVMLVALGYEQGTDFEWADVLAFAKDKGLASAADFENKTYLTANDVAEITVEALKATCKDGKVLAEKLIDAGVIDADLAVKVGLVEKVGAITLTATGSKKLTVKFDGAVDTSKVKIEVKKGSVTVNVDSIEFAEDKKSAVITTATNLTEGEYTVIVSGIAETALTATVKVQDVKVSKINILSEKAPRLADDDKKALVRYEVLNQYGEKMTGQSISWTISTGKPVSNENTTEGTFVIESASGTFVPGTIVYITGVHAASATVVNAQVEIALASQANEVKFKGVYDTEKSKLVDLPAGFKDGRYVLLFEVIDQYGNKMSNPDHSQLVFTSDNPMFISSDTSAGAFDKATEVEIDDVSYEAVDLVRGSAPEKGGTVNIKVISTVTGKQSVFTIDATALAAVKTFSMSAPAGIVAETEEVEIPFVAVDQYGNEVKDFEALDGKVTLSPEYDETSKVGLRFVEQDDGTAKLMYTAPATGASEDKDLPVYLTSLVKEGGDFSSLMIYVKDKAVPTAVIGLSKDVATSIAYGNSVEIKAKDITVQDQHGRTMKSDKVEAWLEEAANNKILLTSVYKASNDNSPFEVTTSAPEAASDAEVQYISSKNDKFIITSKKLSNLAATEKMVFALSTKEENGVPVEVAASAKSVTFTKVEKSAYEKYEIGDLGKMYNDGIANATTSDKYNKTVKVYGVLPNGTKVELPGSDFTVSVDAKDYLKVDGSVISDVYSGGYDDVDFEDSTGNYKDIKVTVMVTVNDANGAAITILEKEMLISNKDPEVATVTFDDEKVTDGKATINPSAAGAIDAALLKSFIEKVADQYGVEYKVDEFGTQPKIYITNLTKTDDSKIKVSNNGTENVSISGATRGDKFTATFKYGNVSAKIDFTVGLAK